MNVISNAVVAVQDTIRNDLVNSSDCKSLIADLDMASAARNRKPDTERPPYFI
jgi:hypothetical protein